MSKKVLAVAILGVLVIASIDCVLLLSMGNTSDTSANTEKPNFYVMLSGPTRHNVLLNNETTINVLVQNTGTADGICELNVTIDGAVVKSIPVFLEKGKLTTVTYNISSSVLGKHTVQIKGYENYAATGNYFVCHDRYQNGSYMRYHVAEMDLIRGVFNYEYKLAVMTLNETSYTMNVTFENNVYPYQEYSRNKTDLWSNDKENLTFVGLESVSTNYGLKTLSHWKYTIESNGRQFEVDTYRDDVTEAEFRTVFRSGDYVETHVLVDTNRVWMKEI